MSERNMSEHGAQFMIGKLIDTDGAQRDAIHVAVAPVVATERLAPGQRIGLVGHDNVMVKASPIGQGIVDPFLPAPVFPGEKFWMFLMPNTITSLRHQWSHPNFDSDKINREDHVSKSKAWIAEHAELLGLSADVLMSDAAEWIETERYKVQHDSERWRDNFNPIEFWHHYEVVTGKPVDDQLKQSFYCCTC